MSLVADDPLLHLIRSGFESKLKILEQQLDSVVGNNLEKGMQSVSERWVVVVVVVTGR